MLTGASFLFMALAQSALAFGLLTFPSRRTYLLTAALSLGIVALWALSRTVGVPVGPEAGTRQPVGMPDAVAALLELLTALSVLALLVTRQVPGRKRRRTREGWARTYALVGGLSLYTLAFTGVAVVPAVTSHGSGPATEARGAHNPPASQGHGSHSETASRPVPAAAVDLTARQMSFGTRRLAMVAGRQVNVRLQNRDDAPHNFSVYRDARFQDSVFNGDVTKGGGARTYRFKSPAPGQYWFRCDLHPTMSGEVAFT